MEIKLNVELKVPECMMSNLAEVDKTRLEGYLQECLVEYLSTSKQGTKEFKFDDLSDMSEGIEAELLPREFVARAKSTQPFKFDDLTKQTKRELDNVQQILSDFALNGKKESLLFKFDDIGAIANK